MNHSNPSNETLRKIQKTKIFYPVYVPEEDVTLYAIPAPHNNGVRLCDSAFNCYFRERYREPGVEQCPYLKACIAIKRADKKSCYFLDKKPKSELLFKIHKGKKHG